MISEISFIIEKILFLGTSLFSPEQFVLFLLSSSVLVTYSFLSHFVGRLEF